MTTAAAPCSLEIEIPKSISDQTESELCRIRFLANLEKIKSTRKANLGLVVKSFSSAQNSALEEKVADLICVYRAALEMRDELPVYRIATCDQFLDEVEKCLSHFLSHKILFERKMSVSQILGLSK
jgi:hypothetical protein